MSIRRQYSLIKESTYVVLKVFGRYGSLTPVKRWTGKRIPRPNEPKFYGTYTNDRQKFKHDYYDEIVREQALKIYLN